MSNPFDSVLIKAPQSSRFDLSHEVKTTINFGNLTPVMCQEILPGDTWRMSSQVFMRAMPLISPVMHNVDVYVHNYYVPYRCVFADWDNFIKGGDDNMTDIPKPVLKLPTADWRDWFFTGSLGDYFGLPVDLPVVTTNQVEINALPFMAYQMIYENYYADQNLEKLVFDKVKRYILDNPIITPSSSVVVDGVEISLFNYLLNIRNRCWAHDYFTSALPNTQRGADVHLPLYGQANLLLENNSTPSNVVYGGATMPSGSYSVDTYNAASGFQAGEVRVEGLPGQIDVTPHTVADLSSALGATINDFREAMQLQRYNELIARVGNRVKEWYKGVWDVNVPDMRLNLPEYLGGAKAPVVISEVLQQSQTTDSSPQGNMAGRATSAGIFGFGKKYFPEYGVVISILSVIPKPSYQQGLHKMWFKSDRFDFGQPIFANLGEQPVYNKEIYFADDGKNDDVFGYLPRYSEYKYIPSQVTGDMRGTLDFWHLGRIFGSRPELNRDFVHTDHDDLDRIFAVQGAEEYSKFVCQIFHRIRARRKLPYYSVPI